MRAALREGLAALLPRIRAKVADPEASLADLVKVADLLARYGLGTQREDDVTVRDVTFNPAQRAARVLELLGRAEQRAKRT